MMDLPLELQLIEHGAVLLLLLVIVVLLVRSRKPVSYIQLVDAIKTRAGPPNVLQWPAVKEAPTPTMDVDSLGEGEVVTHRDGRGSIYRFKLGEGVFVNMYHTKAGYRRSGDLHDCNQYDVVLKGRTRLRMVDPHTGREVVQEFKENDFIVIPARTPHMFEFLEDNYLLEWWDAEFRAWYYHPYRSVIERNAPLTDTDAADFSVRLEDVARGLQAAAASGKKAT